MNNENKVTKPKKIVKSLLLRSNSLLINKIILFVSISSGFIRTLKNGSMETIPIKSVRLAVNEIIIKKTICLLCLASKTFQIFINFLSIKLLGFIFF